MRPLCTLRGQAVLAISTILKLSSGILAVEFPFWTQFRHILNIASMPNDLACGAAAEGVALQATADALLQSHALVINYRTNTSSSFLNSGSFLESCEAYVGSGWAEGVMPCIFGFISSVACIAHVQSDFSSYFIKTRDTIGFTILDSLGPWEGKAVLDWLYGGSSKHLWQWLANIVCSGWKGLPVLEKSGWPLLSNLLFHLHQDCSKFSRGPVLDHVMSRLSGFYSLWWEEQQHHGQSIQTQMPKELSLSLEALMYKYHTDKSRDDHKYSDLYGMLFDPLRQLVTNVTELGVMAGQSLKVWHEYFGNAKIYGIDIFAYFDLATIQAEMAPFKRVQLFAANSQQESAINALGLAPGSMDLVIDDASHTLANQERSLHVMWRFVRAGGYYVIEDLEWNHAGHRGTYPIIHYPEQLRRKTLDILEQNDAFFADTTVGHRAFDLWARRLAVFSPGDQPEGLKTMDRISHSSHMLIIRKRVHPLPPVAVQMNVNAMVI